MADFLKERWLPILLTVITVIFIAQNTNDTRIDFLWIGVVLPLWLTLTAVTALGVAIGLFIAKRRSEV